MSKQRDGLVIGVISDTHGHLYPEVKDALAGVDHIVHAGDVGMPELLTELCTIAPVTAARGNCDTGAWADSLPLRAEVELGGARILVGHIGGRLREEAAASRNSGRASADVVIFGHSHQALVERKDGVLYLNPGSAGPRRYGRPRTMAFLKIAPATSGKTAPKAGAIAAETSAEIIVLEG